MTPDRDHRTESEHRSDLRIDRNDQHRDDRPRPGKVHLETAREAGFGRISPLSIVAGTMVAYGTFAIVAAIAGGLLSNTDLETDFRTDDWTSSGAAAGLVTALVLLAAYLFGGYVAGRMARRSGVLHGVGVFVLSLVVGMVVGGVASLGDGVDVADNLRSIGVPTEWDQVESVGVAAAVASLVAMLLGSLIGGMVGERWHTKLADRFEDPAYGPAAAARERAAQEDQAHDGRRDADRVLHHDTDPSLQRRQDRDRDLRRDLDDDVDRDRDLDRREREMANDRDAGPAPGQDRDIDDEDARINALVDQRVEQRLREREAREHTGMPDDPRRAETIDLRPPPPVEADQVDDRDRTGRRF